jgi:hypothetical protein
MLFELFITNCFQSSLLSINYVYDDLAYKRNSKMIQKRQDIHAKFHLKHNLIIISQI